MVTTNRILSYITGNAIAKERKEEKMLKETSHSYLSTKINEYNYILLENNDETNTQTNKQTQ